VRTTPSPEGLVSLGAAVAACGWLYLAVTVGLAAFKREERTRNEDGVWDTYVVMLRILKMPSVQTFMLVHLIAKLGFQANDGATALKLIDKGFGQDNMALAVLIDFPFEIGLGYYIGKWSSVYAPMRLWSLAFVGRLVAALVAQVVVWAYPAGGVTAWYLGVVVVNHVFSTFMSTAMFVAIAAFHARIADPMYGGTYMTLLATCVILSPSIPTFELT
jgi:MFS transporter, PAT family, solute carrier family 33 (acetyl-CoA transportor), member 1